MSSFREAMARSTTTYNPNKHTLPLTNNRPVEHVYAEKDFVTWAHGNLGFKDIRDTIQRLNSADKVWVGRVYNAWKNKTTNVHELFAGQRYIKPNRPVCETCGASLSRTDCFNNLHFGDGSGRCSLHYTTPTIDSTPPTASDPLPTAHRFPGYGTPDPKYKNVISKSTDDTITCTVCNVVLSMSDVIANRKARVLDRCFTHRNQVTSAELHPTVETRPDNVQNEISAKGEELITRLVDRCVENVLKRTLPAPVKASNILMRHTDKDVKDSDAEEATDDLMMSALIDRIDSDISETKAVEAPVKLNLRFPCGGGCNGECTGADMIKFKRNICSLCHKRKLTEEQTKEEFLSKNYVAPNVKFNN